MFDHTNIIIILISLYIHLKLSKQQIIKSSQGFISILWLKYQHDKIQQNNQMKLNVPLKKSHKSLSCFSLQKQIIKEHNRHPLNSSASKSQQFIPFCSERRLGKLISSSSSSKMKNITHEQLLQNINFRNFHSIYTLVLNQQNKNYSEISRNPGQKNLINQQWKRGTLPQQSHHSCELNNKKETPKKGYPSEKNSVNLKSNNFQKMNLQLYKKLSQVKQPQSNAELHQLYTNYINICEMNENIRRRELCKIQLRSK